MTKRLSCSNLSSICCPSLRPVRASQRGALMRSGTDVFSRNSLIPSGCLSRTSSARKSKTWRLLPEKVSTKLERFSRSRIERAASWRAAIQPSVTSSSVATSAAERVSPITPFRKAVASSVVKRSSAALISVTWSLARSLARGGRVQAAGDDEEDVLRQVLQQESSSLMYKPGVDHVIVVEDYGDILALYFGQLVDQDSHYRLDRRELRQTQRG